MSQDRDTVETRLRYPFRNVVCMNTFRRPLVLLFALVVAGSAVAGCSVRVADADDAGSTPSTSPTSATSSAPSNARDRAGSGLGLALVRTIVERHGGEVAITSREGDGTRVRPTLPAAG